MYIYNIKEEEQLNGTKYKSLAVSSVAKKVLMDIFQSEFLEEEKKLPPERPPKKLHQKIYRFFERKVKPSPPDVPPTIKEMDIPGITYCDSYMTVIF